MSLTTAPKVARYCSSQCERSGGQLQKRKAAPSGKGSGRQCKCGSTPHLRTSSRDCPLSKNLIKAENLSNSDESDDNTSGYSSSTGERSGDLDNCKRER